jgi:outer membrane protein assembly factor BamB
MAMRAFKAVCWIFLAGSLLAAGDLRRGRSILVAQYQGPGGNRIIEVSAEGKLVWEHQVPSLCVIVQPLPNRHVVYAYGGKPTGAREVDREGKVVWEVVRPCPQALSCERLPNGNTLIGEQGPCQAVEISPTGAVVSAVKLPTTETAYHQQLRTIHRLPNGNVLAAIEAEGAAREVDPQGKVVWEFTGLANVFEALRLANGNTLVGCGTQKRVVEVSPAGKVVWELTGRDVPDVNLTWVTSLQVLKNGNYLIGNFLRGQEGRGAHAFEVTREKKVVWTFADHALVTTATLVRAIEED